MSWTSNQIDGPIPIVLLDEQGVPTGQFAPGCHVNTTQAFVAAHPEAATFRPEPAPATLRRVWAGDDAADPVQTAPLLFADEDEARAVLGWIEAGPDVS